MRDAGDDGSVPSWVSAQSGPDYLVAPFHFVGKLIQYPNQVSLDKIEVGSAQQIDHVSQKYDIRFSPQLFKEAVEIG